MLSLTFARPQPLRVLCLGAHCDDIEIGCGGTMLRLMEATPGLQVRWVVFTGPEHRQHEARTAAAAVLASADARVDLHSFPESYLPMHWGDVKDEFERIKTTFQPDLIFTHRNGDAHQDHRVVSELTWNTFRDHLILEYEIPKYEGDLGNPNLFIPITADHAERKAALITRSFVSQQDHAWFDKGTFLAMLRLRGIGCNAPSGFAEAFTARKMVA